MPMVDNDDDTGPQLRVRTATADATRLHVRTWRNRAEELRTIADDMTDNHSRRLMLNAARNYDRMADEYEERDRPEASQSQPETG
jgi:hypothetical protein